MMLSSTEFIIVAVAFFIAIWNTSVGPSGAVTFATMATLLPTPIVVPIHAATETAANIIRTLLLSKFVDWRFVGPFAFAGLFGFALGIPLIHLASSSQNVMQIILGSFILIATWIPLTRLAPEKGFFPAAGGIVTSFLTLFVGATTPLVAATIGQRHDDHRVVLATSAACMLYQHMAKIPIFGVLGFPFGQHLVFLCYLILATTLGTYLGRHLLLKLPMHIVRPIFKLVITALAGQLLYTGVSSLIA